MDLIDQFYAAVNTLQGCMPLLLGIIASLYIIQIINFLLGYRLNLLGIYPRHPLGLLGIAFAPLLHGGFNHLFFNSIALFALMAMLILNGIEVFYSVSLEIIIISGSMTWLFGCKALHVGASGVIMGYWAYLMVNAIQAPDLMSIALGAVSLYYFGGLALSLVPGEKGVSWEGHLFGAGAGVAAVYASPWLMLNGYI